jgi:epoxyqueuosine reductase QueG
MSHSLLQTLNSFFESHEFVLDWSHVSLSKKIPHSEELKTWIENKWHGEMSFMENNLELRLDPTKIEPWLNLWFCFYFLILKNCKSTIP